jgi:hypothetical protein
VTSTSRQKPYEALRHRDFRRMAISMLVSLVGLTLLSLSGYVSFEESVVSA